jgi:dihydroorotate dehydrogenase electron transfer subunit
MRVDERQQESSNTTTLFFERRRNSGPAHTPPDFDSCEPGQFMMLWLPGIGEKPYALSYLDGSRVGVTVMERGPFSRKLSSLEPGDAVGFRGPYGRGFWGVTRNGPSAAIGGGCGMAALALLKDRSPGCMVVQGAPTEDQVLWQERFPHQRIYTEDGSCGEKGLPTEWLRERLEKGDLESVYTCGPEPMMAAVVKLCREAGVDCQASLERYMKCAIGICGQCECDGWLVCQDGPVFSAEELGGMPSFGKVERTKSGRKKRSGGEECSS